MANSSRAQIWTGYALQVLVVLFMLMDALSHLFKPAPVVQAFNELGFPLSLSGALGVIAIVCVIFYAIPRTRMFGLILLTGYLGGAIAVQARVGNPPFETLFPLIVAVLAWGGIFLRDARLRQILTGVNA